MTHSKKQETVSDFSVEELELPPLADDTAAEPEPDVLTGVLGTFEEIGAGAEDAEVARITEQEVVADLIATGEVSLLNDTAFGVSPTVEPGQMEEDFHQSDGSWISNENDVGLEVVDLVGFEQVVSDSEAIEDNGAEGPVEEPIHIDTSGWDVLEAAHEDEPQETVHEAMRRLGIDLPPETPSLFGGTGQQGTASPGECHFLGPQEASAAVRSLALGAAGPLAVGLGIFQIAADGLFHRMLELHEIERAVPTSCFVVGNSLFVGTRTAGLLTVDLKARSVRPNNGWMSLGWASSGANHSSVSTSILTYCLPRQQDVVIFVETNEGQVFSSEDLGATWRGPLLHERVQCTTVNRSSGELVVLCTGDAERLPMLQISRDQITYDALRLPKELATILQESGPEYSRSLVLAAAGGTIAVGVVGQLDHLWISLDRGVSWRRDSSKMRVSALCIDPESPSWLAAACAGPDGRQGCLKLSEDGGRHWITMADPFETEDAAGQLQPAGAIIELDLAVQATDRRVYAVTPRGVFEIVVSKQDGLH